MTPDQQHALLSRAARNGRVIAWLARQCDTRLLAIREWYASLYGMPVDEALDPATEALDDSTLAFIYQLYAGEIDSPC